MNVHAIYRTISPYFRARRMRRFAASIQASAGHRILDVGGTPSFWATAVARENWQLTLLNQDREVAAASRQQRINFVIADACALPFPDHSFDVVFSNSVIEHVGTWERQQAFAAEARRVGKKLWIQTPAREFFIEPHLIAPFIHWLPRRMQRNLIRNFTVRGWLERPTPAGVDEFLDEVRLVTFREIKVLFPDCTILRERFLGLTKSYIALRTAS